MKKMLAFAVCLCLLFLPVCHCFAENIDISNLESMSQEELIALYKSLEGMIEPQIKELTAGEIVEKLADIGFPIYDTTVYNETTDPNNLLGRPKQYTSKCNAFEKRVKRYYVPEESSHIAVEVFENEEDCTARYEYINSLNPVLVGQYLFQHKNVLFRIDNDLLPSEAEQYNEAIEAIVAGREYVLENEIVVTQQPQKTIYTSLSASDNKIPPSTSRQSPAAVGQRVLLNDVAITILNTFVGQKANTLARSFSSYNTKSYSMKKTEEWLMAFVKIEGLKTLNNTELLSSHSFSVVSKDGIILSDGYSSLSGNPREISDVIPGSVQYCWYGVPIEKGTEPLIFFEDYSLGEAWFDVYNRVPADTSNETYTLLKRNDVGLLVDRIQIALYDYGYRKDVPDGVFGNLTINSIKKFQTDCGLEPTGQTDDETLRWLLSGKPVPEK